MFTAPISMTIALHADLKRYTHLAVMAFFFLTSTVHGQSILAVAPPQDGGGSNILTEASPNGRSFIARVSANEFILEHLHADGAIAWSRRLTSSLASVNIGQFDMKRTAQGHIQCLYISNVTYTPTSDPDVFTRRTSLVHVLFSGAGDVLEMGTIRRNEPLGPDVIAYEVIDVEVEPDSNEGFTFLLSTDKLTKADQYTLRGGELVQVSFEDGILSSRRFPYYLPSQRMPLPLLRRSSGDIQYVVHSIFGTDGLIVSKLDGQNDVLWSKDYRFNNETTSRGFTDAATNSAGDLTLLGYTEEGLPLVRYVALVLLDGTGEVTDLTMGQINNIGQDRFNLRINEYDHRIILSSAFGNLNYDQSTWYMLIEGGQTSKRLRRYNNNDGQFIRFHSFKQLETIGDRIHVGGHFMSYDLSQASFTSMHGTADIELGSLDPCLFVEESYDFFQVFGDDVISEALEIQQPTNTISQWSVLVQTSEQVEVLPNPSTLNPCLISTGIRQVQRAQEMGLMLPSHSVICAADIGFLSCQVFDMNGKEIAALGTREELIGLLPGIYVVSGVTLVDGTAKTVRLLVHE